MLESLPLVEITPNFCPRDGTPLGDEFKFGKPRRVCPTCGYIYGRDPRVVVGLLIRLHGDLLFVPRNEGWSLPVYFYDDRIDPRVLVGRSFETETGLSVTPHGVIDTFSIEAEGLGKILVAAFQGDLDSGSDIAGTSLRTADALLLAESALTPITRLIIEHPSIRSFAPK